MQEQEKLKILKRVLGDCYSKSDENLFYCPKCDHHKKKLSINITKNVFKCWVCDWSGKNIYRIIRQYGTPDQRYTWKSFASELEIENFNHKLFNQEESIIANDVKLPKEFMTLTGKNLSSTSLRPLNYLKSRGLTNNDIIKWKIGYCASGEYGGRIIIPSFNLLGEINYFVARSYDQDWKKYSNPNISKNIIFNHPYVDFDEDVILVEGVFDAIKAGDNSVPLLGSTLSENSNLFYEIVKNDTPVYLGLDPDALKKTNKLIKLFLKYDIETYLIDVAPFGDVGEMSCNEFLSRKLSASVLNTDNYLLSRIKGI